MELRVCGLVEGLGRRRSGGRCCHPIMAAFSWLEVKSGFAHLNICEEEVEVPTEC